MRVEKYKKVFFVVGIILFWSIVIFQQFGDREDIPFTYYGMYKGLQGDSCYEQLEFTVILDRRIVETQTYLDDYIVKERIYRNLASLNNKDSFYSSRLRFFNEDYVDQLAENELAVFKNVIVDEFDSRRAGRNLIKDVEVKVVIKRWKRLTREKMLTPDWTYKLPTIRFATDAR
jgi:hypothetical protein